MNGSIPLSRLVRTELRKLTDTRAGRWLLIAIVATTPIVMAGMLIIATPKDLTYDRFVDFTTTPQKILLPVLGILTITSEWSQRTGLVTFTLEPDRKRVLLAKAVATMLLGLLVIAITYASAAIGNVLGTVQGNGNGSWHFGLTGFRDITLVQIAGLSQGLGFGMLLLVSAAAIVAFYVVPNLSGAVFGNVKPLKSLGQWVDYNISQGNLYNHTMNGEHWAQLLTAMLLWVGLPLVVGVARVLRSEVKSG